MSTVEDLEDREEQPHVGWVPRVIRGGKGPPEGPTEDWLSPLEPYTVFVCSARNSTDGNLFKLIWKGQRFSLLQLTINDDTFERYVNTREFCKTFKEYEILGVDNPPSEEEENNEHERTHPDGDRSD